MDLHIVCIGQWLNLLVPISFVFGNVVGEPLEKNFIELLRLLTRLRMIGHGGHVLYAEHAAHCFEYLRHRMTPVRSLKVKMN